MGDCEGKEVDSRLGKLYDAIETGEFKSGELAPRIKTLSQKKEELLQAKTEVEEILRYDNVDMADSQIVQDYADDLSFVFDKLKTKNDKEELIIRYRNTIKQRVMSDQSIFDLLYPLATKEIRTEWLTYLIQANHQIAVAKLEQEDIELHSASFSVVPR